MKQVAANRIPVRLKRVLQEYLQRHNGDQPVSIANVIQRTRYALPDISLSDDELEQVIAKEVIKHKGNIAFDRRSADPRSQVKN